ncbi:sensor histidine kinase [Rhodococcus tukisamuensis]|uniref:histidine kinase n=1 Tax=Rhodococcus tukisamuensis TaxID=168276 RepID=A0A1G6NTN7_9NOCA|nr:HAMP domain-containing sensor histidine kinase [Rhodococcus tukisamuensis]SDC70714.1 two-component system, OmpR family, sensor kinase [Rhodococcus tukisamuensis]
MRPLRRMPLRFTLVAALLVLAGLGLLASGVAVTSALENSLIARTDATLRDAAHGWAKPRGDRPLPPPGEAGPARPPTQFYVRTVTNDGTVNPPINDGKLDPDLPADPGPDPVTVGSIGHPDQHWRALTAVTPEGAVTVAIRLADVDQTVERLVGLQVGIGVVVLSVLGVAGYLVVRRSLRPLVEVEHTAAAIAAGDLHRRVPERDERTEIGRLSVALNGMLTQIQTAFAATEASEESARRSEDRMRRFVADASHELRTPLTTIRGFAELYRQGATTDTDMLMARIEGEASRMGLLVEDLLMLARLDAQRPLAQEHVDLLTVASDAVHDARAIAPDREIALEVVDGPGCPQVLGDDARLRQVLTNLVSNALGHTPDSASVTVRVGTVGPHALLEVADTGPGLDEQARERVFERFYRADTSRTRESGGSGLGLSIVAALVAAHGGTVTVDSPAAGGAVFRVLLPRADGGADADVAASPSRTASWSADPELK